MISSARKEKMGYNKKVIAKGNGKMFNKFFPCINKLRYENEMAREKWKISSMNAASQHQDVIPFNTKKRYQVAWF